MFLTEHSQKSISTTRSSNSGVGIKQNKCVSEVTLKKKHSNVPSKGQLQLQNDSKKKSPLVVGCTSDYHLPPVKVDKVLVGKKVYPSTTETKDSYFLPILVPVPVSERGTLSNTLNSFAINTSKISCQNDACILPIKPKAHRLVPLIRQAALEDSNSYIVTSNCNDFSSKNVTTVNSDFPIKKPVCVHNRTTDCVSNSVKATPTKPKKSLLGEFTHFPSFWRIFPAKPSPTILPPLSGFFQAVPNISTRKTKKMATSPTLDQSVSAIITPTVLIHRDLLTNGDEEDSQEGLSPVLVPTVVSRPPFVHTVSIVVEPVTDAMCDGSSMDEADTDEFSSTDIDDDLASKSVTNEDLVKTVMDHARLRKEEFARLLEEHAQIVNEINKAENKKV